MTAHTPRFEIQTSEPSGFHNPGTILFNELQESTRAPLPLSHPEYLASVGRRGVKR